jgi:tetratricopeptide (TPR) repeat protein
MMSLIIVLGTQARFAEATAYYRAAESNAKLIGDDRLTSWLLNNAGAMHVYRGDLHEAEALFARAAALKRQALGSAHHDVGLTLQNLAEVCLKSCEYDRAASYAKEAWALLAGAMGPWSSHVGNALFALAQAYEGSGNFEAARKTYRNALDIYGKTMGENSQPAKTAGDHLLRCSARA